MKQYHLRQQCFSREKALLNKNERLYNLDDFIYSEIKGLITPKFLNDRDFLNELVLRLACFAKDDYNGLSRFRL